MDDDAYTWTDPRRCSGRTCFRGTRIPVYILFEYLAAGETVEQFLEQYPSLDAEMVVGSLPRCKAELERPAA